MSSLPFQKIVTPNFFRAMNTVRLFEQLHLFFTTFLIYNITFVNGGLVRFSIVKWLDEIQADGYDKLITPGSLQGNTTNVKIEIYVEHIGNFRSTSMDYEMEIFFIQHWMDSRLQHNRSGALIFSDKSQLDRLWIPDIYFSNSKSAQYNSVMVPNMNIRIWPNGDVRLGTRISLKIFCHMDLSSYPIDVQVCHLKIQTCATDFSLVNVTWLSNKPVSFDSDIKYGDLALEKTEVENCNGSYYNYSYSCLLAKFYLHRSVAYSLLQTYIPTTFIVIISWISFWIDPTSVPGRVALSVTTLLTLSTQVIATHFNLPPIAYANAQDYWFALCLLFLFFALVEFAVVNTFSRLEEHERRMFERNSKLETIVEASTDGKLLPKKRKPVRRYRSMALMIDRCARIGFPAAFAIFCTGYWWYFAVVRKLAFGINS